MAKNHKRVTVADVARAAGVSKSTVSLVFSAPHRVAAATYARVLEAARVSGYAPDPLAQSLSRGRSNTIGLIVRDMTNPHFGTVLEKVQATAGRAGYMVMTATASNDPRCDLDYVSRFEKLRLPGLIITSSGLTAYYRRALKNSAMRFVTYGQHVPELQCDHVGLQNVVATQILVQHLVSRGHRRIGHIAGDLRTWTGQQRLLGVQSGLNQAGLSLDQQDLIYGNYDEKISERVTQTLLKKRSRPTALIAANNFTAVGAMRAIRKLQLKCPSDIALATVDAIQFNDLFTPSFTCVVQPISKMAQTAADILIGRLEGTAEEDANLFKEFVPSLHIGGTT